MNPLDSLRQVLADASGPLGDQVGADPATTEAAVAVALPALVAALARNTSDPAGAESLHAALRRDHDGHMLDDVDGYLRQPDVADGRAILGHVLGGQTDALTAGLARQTGIDADLLAQLLPIIAPIVLAQLGKTQREGGLDAGGLAEVLTGERRKIEREATPGGALGDLVAGMLDRDRDGDTSDDAVKIGIDLLGQLFGGRRR